MTQTRAATTAVIGGGASGVLTAISRHGLLPYAHVAQMSTAWVSELPEGPLSADRLVAMSREQVASARRNGVGWRAVVDGLRAPTQGLWQRLPLDERRPEGELLDEEGRVVPGLYAVGPPRKGTLYESTAIPEIRTQAAEVAAAVLARRAESRAQLAIS